MDKFCLCFYPCYIDSCCKIKIGKQKKDTSSVNNPIKIMKKESFIAMEKKLKQKMKK